MAVKLKPIAEQVIVIAGGRIVSILNDLLRRTSEDKTKDNANLANKPARSLYTRAVTHPVATVGLVTAAVGVTAAVAFALAEQRAHRGIEREIARGETRFGKRVRYWADEEAPRRVARYRRKASRWVKRHNPWD